MTPNPDSLEQRVKARADELALEHPRASDERGHVHRLRGGCLTYRRTTPDSREVSHG